ncbi:MAG: Gfo/Idh/MocA family protein [Acidobacteriaceae bacterium]
MNRRNLLQGISMSVLSAKLLRSPSLYGEALQKAAEPMVPSEPVRIGVIGPGSRGKELIRQMLRVPGVDITAVCDVYEPRFTQVNELVGKTIPGYKDHRELLERKDIDAIVIASPPLFHAQHVIDSIKSGRPVYGEKTMGFSPQDCYDIVETVTKTGQIYQVGHQNRYAPWFQESIKRIHQGEIGEPTHIYAYWFRHDNWRRTVPTPSLEHLMNWRLYRESSGGLLEELGSHQIDVANWIFGEHPQTVLGTTSIVCYHDGRTVGDNVQAVLGYSKGRRLVFSSLTDNAIMGDQLWIYGTKGSVQLTVEDATFYGETRKTITAASHSNVVRRGIKTGASYKVDDEMPYRGPGDRIDARNVEDPTLTACRSFIHCVRTKTQPIADVRVGFGSAMACSIGKNAVFEGTIKDIPQMKTDAL